MADCQSDGLKSWQFTLRVHGADKVWRQLNREGIAIARGTVERLVCPHGMQATSSGGPAGPREPAVFGNPSKPVVGRRFHLRFDWQGFVHVAFVIDVHARYIVGWRVSRSMRTDFVLDALEQGVRRTGKARKGVVVQS